MPLSSPTPTMQIVGGCPLHQQIEKPQDFTLPLLANKLYHSSYASSALPKILPQLLHLASPAFSYVTFPHPPSAFFYIVAYLANKKKINKFKK
jgi:hypothetical protein